MYTLKCTNYLNPNTAYRDINIITTSLTINNIVLEPTIKGLNNCDDSRLSPAPGSLRAVLLKNSTTRLFVHPLELTADHLTALDMDIVSSSTADQNVDDECNDKANKSPKLKDALYNLRHIQETWRDQQMRIVVSRPADTLKLKG
jgi:hypothetical protein